MKAYIHLHNYQHISKEYIKWLKKLLNEKDKE